ncbi:unnamed protein product [Clavelina lepadiformis]|uniref:Uncharacterized protein n=1 Tax=Clavelina lepadiformis TaxID=159417 RepID=A0ABP0GBC1_CLALP
MPLKNTTRKTEAAALLKSTEVLSETNNIDLSTWKQFARNRIVWRSAARNGTICSTRRRESSRRKTEKIERSDFKNHVLLQLFRATCAHNSFNIAWVCRAILGTGTGTRD